MSNIRIEDLNGYDKFLIINGCKPEWMPKWINADLVFKEACAQHDIDYFAGGCDLDRKKADKKFFEHMSNLIKEKKFNWFKRWWYIRASVVYYNLVSEYGHKSFEYRYRKKGNENIPFTLEKYDLPSYSPQADYRFTVGAFKNIRIKVIKDRWCLASEEV